ncbi:hypothetical protein [Kribbella endophytica]
MDLVSAAVGAVFGGILASIVAWVQTRTTLRHDLALFQQEMAAERGAMRESARRAAISDALHVLGVAMAEAADLRFRFAFLGGNVPGYVRDGRRNAEAILRELGTAKFTCVALLNSEVQQAWDEVSEAAWAVASSKGEEAKKAAMAEFNTLASSLHSALAARLTEE